MMNDQVSFSYTLAILFSCRHTPEKKAKRPRLSLLHFGAGPRECTGKQLAPVMLKMAVVETLQKYKLIQAADTEVR